MTKRKSGRGSKESERLINDNIVNEHLKKKIGFFGAVRAMINEILDDIKHGCERDPAARNYLEFVLLYPGFHAIILHRIAHLLWVHNFLFTARIISFISRFWTGCDIVSIFNE